MQIFLLLVFAWAATLLLVPGVIALAWRMGALDYPGEARRIHKRAIPRIGGLAFFSAFLITCFFANAITGWVRFALAGAVIVFAAGLADDLFGMPAWLKFFFQVLAAAFAVGGMENRSWAGALVSFFWLVLLTNAHNLIDGMDGLLAGTAILESLTLAAALFSIGKAFYLPLYLAAVCFAFYAYNQTPATIFAGDCGSGTIGFLLGAFSLPLFRSPTWNLGVLSALFVMAYPVVEVYTTLLRRFLRQKPLFVADRGHLHHLLFDLGFSTSTSARMLHLVCGVFAILGALLTRPDLAPLGAVACVCCIVTLLSTRLFIRKRTSRGNIGKRVDFSAKT